MPAIKFRRIVTGHDEHGAAIVAHDSQPPNVRSFTSLPGVYFTEIWSTAQTPAVIDNGSDPTLNTTGIQPPPGGSVIRVVDIPPEGPGGHTEAATGRSHFAELGAADAATSTRGSKHALMHRTETLDYGIVLEGSLTLVLDGSEVEISQGDIIVQRGTNHAWSNRSGKLCRMAFILLDGRYAPEIRSALQTGVAGQ